MRLQADLLAERVCDIEPYEASAALARRIDALGLPFRIAILQVIEAFWIERDRAISIERFSATLPEFLAGLGVRVGTGAHRQLEARQFRQRMAAGGSMARPAAPEGPIARDGAAGS